MVFDVNCVCSLRMKAVHSVVYRLFWRCAHSFHLCCLLQVCSNTSRIFSFISILVLSTCQANFSGYSHQLPISWCEDVHVTIVTKDAYFLSCYWVQFICTSCIRFVMRPAKFRVLPRTIYTFSSRFVCKFISDRCYPTKCIVNHM